MRAKVQARQNPGKIIGWKGTSIGVEKAVLAKVPGNVGKKGLARLRRLHSIRTSRRPTDKAVHMEASGDHVRLVRIGKKTPQEIKAALRYSRSRMHPSKARTSIEIGDHYLGRAIKYDNASVFLSIPITFGIKKRKGIRTVLIDDVNLEGRVIGGKAVEEKLFRSLAGREHGERVVTIRESSAKKVYEELNQRFGLKWEAGRCKHFDAIIYIKKLGLEKVVADNLARKYNIPVTEVLSIFRKHFRERIPRAKEALVVLPKYDERFGERFKLEKQQRDTKNVLNQLFGLDPKLIEEKIKVVYFDSRKLKELGSQYGDWSAGKLPNEKRMLLKYHTITFQQSNVHELRNSVKFLKENTRWQPKWVIDARNSSKLVYFNLLVDLVSEYNTVLKRIREADLEAMGDYHSRLVKAINNLASEIDHKHKDGLINAAEIVRELQYQRVLGATNRILNKTLEIMGCKELVK